jgi:hypothetical protein
MKIDEEKIYEYAEVRPGKDKVSTNSPLNYIPILKDEDRAAFLNIHREARIRDLVKTKRILYDLYTIKEGDRWDIISQKHYDTPHLWWLVCFSNDIIDPDEELQAGEEIILLKNTHVYAILTELERLRDY